MSETDLLVVGPHPDDAELHCGGTIAKAVEEGKRVAILDLSAGELATRGTPAARKREAEEAARMLGVAARECVGLPDGGIRNDADQRDRVIAALRKLRPQVVLGPGAQARHPDHANAAALVGEACFFAGLRRHAAGGEPHRPSRAFRYCLSPGEKPSFVVDITVHFEKKLRAIACYRSQFPAEPQSDGVYPPWEEIAREAEAVARAWGRLGGVRFGEAYVMDGVPVVPDIADMPGLSISRSYL